MDWNWMIERAWIFVGGLMCLSAIVGGGVVAAVIAMWLGKLKIANGLMSVHSYDEEQGAGHVYTTTFCPNCGQLIESTISWMGGENCNESLACPHCEQHELNST